MKVAIVRGMNLNKFEMQSYEPLTKKHDLTAYTTYNHKFEIDRIQIPIKKLHCDEEFTGRLPFPFNRFFGSMIYRLGYDSCMLGLGKELKDKDIAHVTETFNAYSYQAVKTKKRHKRPKVVVTVWENIPFRRVNRHVLEVRRNADVFIAITNRAKEALKIEGVDEERIRTIPAGVDMDRFRPKERNRELLKRLNLANDDIIVLFIGRLTWEKGVYDLIYAAKMIYEDPELDNKPIKFLLVGDGIEKEKILEKTKELRISDRVRLIGDVPYIEIHEFHDLADIFVLPSIPTRRWQEQFGMALVEAMASGKATISTLSGSIPEVVGSCSLLVQPNDPLSLHYAIKKLITDEELRSKMGKQATSRARRQFDRNIIANRINEIYEGLVRC